MSSATENCGHQTKKPLRRIGRSWRKRMLLTGLRRPDEAEGHATAVPALPGWGSSDSTMYGIVWHPPRQLCHPWGQTFRQAYLDKPGCRPLASFLGKTPLQLTNSLEPSPSDECLGYRQLPEHPTPAIRCWSAVPLLQEGCGNAAYRAHTVGRSPPGR